MIQSHVIYEQIRLASSIGLLFFYFYYYYFLTGVKIFIDNKLKGKYNNPKANDQPEIYKYMPVGPM
jgi:hypothetical protein